MRKKSNPVDQERIEWRDEEMLAGFANSSESREQEAGAQYDRELAEEAAEEAAAQPPPPPAPGSGDALIPPAGALGAPREIRPVTQTVISLEQDAWQNIPFSDDEEDDFMDESEEKFEDAHSSSASSTSAEHSSSSENQGGGGGGGAGPQDDLSSSDNPERERRKRRRSSRRQQHRRDVITIPQRQSRNPLGNLMPHHDFDYKCDICVYGGGEDFDKHTRNELDNIMALERGNFENSNKVDLYRQILNKRRKHIEIPLARRGLPYKPWTMKMLKEHFSPRSKHTLNARRDLAEEIRRMQKAGDELWRNGILEENRLTNERRVDTRNLKEYRECVKLKLDLWKQYGIAKAEENYHATGSAAAGGGSAVANSSYLGQRFGGANGKGHWSMTRLAAMNTVTHYVLSAGQDE